MKSGTIEVLLVHAEELRHTNIIGRPKYYVIIECGQQKHRSKVKSVKDGKVWWNEKFTFEIPLSEWQNLTHLKIRIMDTELFSDGGFVGEAMIYLRGMITEAIDREIMEIKPSPYNVLLEDGTYKGEIKIGIKFITMEQVRRKWFTSVARAPKSGMYNSISDLLRDLLKKAMFTFKKTKAQEQHKKIYKEN